MAAATISGLSTLGVVLGYAVETTAGTKPEAFTALDRINGIGGLSMDPETIDSSALTDSITRYVMGRADTGGSFTVTVNVTSETIAQWEAAFTASATGRAANKRTWFEIYHPSMTNAFFVAGYLPTKFPIPETSQNSLWTVEIGIVVDELVGLDTAVAPTAG